ncbi:hypothetical protein [Dyella sp. 20L07]|uniref:hypothetical protein n=1 Tax=Dyella sp. 20L07 TaxID=3384240 RepID=UPI003D28586D
MQAKFVIPGPSLLLEAKPGDLFVPIGPDFVECVCARLVGYVESNEDQPHPNHAVPVVVIACRVARSEPEYFQPGYRTVLPAATPVTFVLAVSPLELAQRDHDNSFDDIGHALQADPLDTHRALAAITA